jgi:hypothetical protein
VTTSAGEIVVASVSGSRGHADVIEVLDPQTHQTEYRVLYEGTVETFKTMGEAYITAKEKVDFKG